MVKIWDPKDGKERAAWDTGQYGDGCLLRFAPDGKTIATFASLRDAARLSTEVRLWDAATGNLKLRIPVPDRGELWGSGFQFTPDSKHVAVTSGAEIQFFDATTGKKTIAIRPEHRMIGGFEISPDGRRLLTWAYHRGKPFDGNPDRPPAKPPELFVFDTARRTRLAALTGLVSQVSGARFSPSGTTIVASDSGYGSPSSTASIAELTKDRSPHIFQWDSKTFRIVAGARGGIKEGGGAYRSGGGSSSAANFLSFSQDGSTLAYITRNYVKIWTTNRGKESVSRAPLPGEKSADNATAQDGEYRTWKLREAKTSFEARFVELSRDGKVQLVKKDGKRLTIPIARFTKEDQDFIRNQAGDMK
jgi:WD40 repeat protein